MTNTTNLLKLLMPHFLRSSRHCVRGTFCASASLCSPKGKLSDVYFLPQQAPAWLSRSSLGCHKENQEMVSRVEEKGAPEAQSAQGRWQPQQKSGQESAEGGGRGGRVRPQPGQATLLPSGHRGSRGGASPGCRDSCGRDIGHGCGRTEPQKQRHVPRVPRSLPPSADGTRSQPGRWGQLRPARQRARAQLTSLAGRAAGAAPVSGCGGSSAPARPGREERGVA